MAKFILYSSLFAAATCVIIHFLIANRKLPFLKNDTIYSGGEYIPTEKFVDMLTPMFLYVSPFFVLVGILNYIYFSKKS